jgi:FixJ family two-component response regulator
VALIDDDTRILASLSTLLASGGYGARVYVGAQDFFSDGCSGLVCVITDVGMQPIDGRKVLERMIASKDGLPVIIITGSPEEHLEEYCMAEGAFGFFLKPVDGDALLNLLDRIP